MARVLGEHEGMHPLVLYLALAWFASTPQAALRALI